MAARPDSRRWTARESWGKCGTFVATNATVTPTPPPSATLSTICILINTRSQSQFILRYTASWKHEGVTFTKLFCPVEGDLKPDIPSVRRILSEEGAVFQGNVDEEERQQDKPNACLIA